MYEHFDLDDLGRDLTGNSEISSMLERGLAFMRIEKYEKALEVFDELIDKYPSSPCGWFAKARLASQDFEFCDITSEAARNIVAVASDSLETAKKVVDSERSADYELLTKTYSDKIKRALIKDYSDTFDREVDQLINIAAEAERNTPSAVSTANFRLAVISEAIRNAMYVDNENSIYTLPEEIVEEIGSEYCALSFAAMHICLFEEFLVPYANAFSAQDYDQQRRDARAQMRSNWNVKQGWGSELSRSDIAMLDREYPVYDISYYYKRDTDKEKYSLEGFIRDCSPFTAENTKTYYLENVLKTYEKLYSLLEFPLGNLTAVRLPAEIQEYAAQISEKSARETAERAPAEEYEATGKEIKQTEALLERHRERLEEKRRKNKKVLIVIAVLAALYLIGTFVPYFLKQI